MTTATPSKTATRRPRKMARDPDAQVTPQSEGTAESPTVADSATAKRVSKTSVVLDLLGRAEGATIDQLVLATGWLPHTTRAALTGLKKKGHVISSAKVEGVGRVYRLAAN